MIFDDGTSLTTLPDGDTVAWDATGRALSRVDSATGVINYSPTYYTDMAEARRLQQFAPNPASSSPWYEQVAQYGLMRAIDTHYGAKQTQVPTGSLGATFAGQNGKTYAQGQVSSGATGGGSMLTMLLIGAAALFVLAK